MKVKSALLIFLICISVIRSFGQIPSRNFSVTDGDVLTTAQQGSTLYLGGNFRYIGPNKPHGAPVNKITGEVNFKSETPNGYVESVISDGNGGWYIGGSFTKVGNEYRNGIAKINSDGSLNAWNPGVEGSVNAMVLKDSTIYIGGKFTGAGGLARRNIAAIDVKTGIPVHHWNPQANGIVRALLVIDDILYVGGSFGSIGGEFRNNLAALSLPSGDALPWNPVTNDQVHSLAVGGIGTHSNPIPLIFAVGDFTTVGGNFRGRIASFYRNTGELTDWNPNADNTIFDIEIHGNNAFICGNFRNVGDQIRWGFASLSILGNSINEWNPIAQAGISDMELDGNTLYMAGQQELFLGQQNIPTLGAYDLTTGNRTNWEPKSSPSGFMRLSVSGDNIYVGGSFSSIGGVIRNRLAAIDISTGNLTSWNPSANSTVHTLAISGDTIYVGGSFTVIAGSLQYRLAAIHTSGVLLGWGPSADGTVRSILVDGGSITGRTANNKTIYVGGDFTNIGGQSRSKFAAFTPISNTPTTFNPNADGSIYTIKKFQDVIYVGGQFTQIGGQQRQNLAALSANTGLATTQNMNTNGPVYAITNINDFIFVGGDFSQVMNTTRSKLALLQAPGNGSGFMLNFVHPANAAVKALETDGTQLYIGGDFTTIDGQPRNRIAKIDLPTDLLSSWNPDANWTVNYLKLNKDTLFVGGSFTKMGEVNVSNFAILPTGITPLPVKIQSFTAQRNLSGKVICSWVTNQEQNSSHFVVERSVDRIHYIPIGNVTAAGNSSVLHSYHFTDPSPVNEIAYYRLKQVDQDASYVYSKIVAVTGSKENSVVLLYPNPVKEQANLIISVQTKEKLRFSLFDQAGRMVISSDLLVSAGSNAVNIPIAGLAKGMYTIQIQGPNTVRTLQMVKQ